jgi:hypothetical protein
VSVMKPGTPARNIGPGYTPEVLDVPSTIGLEKRIW